MPGAGFSDPYQFSGLDHVLGLWAAYFFFSWNLLLTIYRENMYPKGV